MPSCFDFQYRRTSVVLRWLSSSPERFLYQISGAMVPIADTAATWDLYVAWRRGKTSGPLRALLDALTLTSGRSS
jgi:hypothetical protein